MTTMMVVGEMAMKPLNIYLVFLWIKLNTVQ